MYCQQILRKTWHGNVPWQSAPFTFKIIHFLLQVILAPFFAPMQCIVEAIREYYYIFQLQVMLYITAINILIFYPA